MSTSSPDRVGWRILGFGKHPEIILTRGPDELAAAIERVLGRWEE